jgi:hypothetical protein
VVKMAEKKDKVTAFADTNQDIEGNYPNEDSELETTIDANQALENRRAKKKARLESQFPEDPAYAPKREDLIEGGIENKATNQDQLKLGNREPLDVSQEYSVKEGKAKGHKGKESPSPLQ